MPFVSIIMSYKENCKVEGEVMAKFKIARGYFSGNFKQKDIATSIKCHPNTVNNIIKKCRSRDPADEIWSYLKSNNHISEEKLLILFNFLKNKPRRPLNCQIGLALNSNEKKVVINKFNDIKAGYKRMYNHLKEQGYDTTSTYTLGNIKGVYRRNRLKAKKIRTATGERRSLYNYDLIAAFEYLQCDTKEILDKHSLPIEIYDKFKNNPEIPVFQWTIIDAKTRVRFLAWSQYRSSFFGFSFLEYVICWLRSHGIETKINIQMDRGSEFYSGSKRKQEKWNKHFNRYNAYVYDTNGAKWRQNLVERSQRIDDEEFYCPRGEFINTKNDFLLEAQLWIIYYNNRSHSGIGMEGMSPKQKLESLGIVNAKRICNFPCLILNDFFFQFQSFFNVKAREKELEEKSQNVLTYYHNVAARS